MTRLVFDREVHSHSIAETEALAAELYRIIGRSALVALHGPLGAGKTSFVRGLARAAGVDPDDVNSPSFTLVNEYLGGETPIFHIDLYRMADPSEFYSIGGEDYLEREGLILIEWAENGEGFIPVKRFTIVFEIVDETTRKLIFTRSGI